MLKPMMMMMMMMLIARTLASRAVGRLPLQLITMVMLATLLMSKLPPLRHAAEHLRLLASALALPSFCRGRCRHSRFRCRRCRCDLRSKLPSSDIHSCNHYRHLSMLYQVRGI